MSKIPHSLIALPGAVTISRLRAYLSGMHYNTPMTIIYNGTHEASIKRALLAKEVEKLKLEELYPKLVSILIGSDAASRLYTNLKKKAAEEVGIAFEVIELPADTLFETVAQKIRELNADETVHGIMLQLPLPDSLFNQTQRLIQFIEPSKDVDGLRSDSPSIPATVKAIEGIIALQYRKEMTVVVVGSKGQVGRRLILDLKTKGMRVLGADKETIGLSDVTLKGDILVSATGVQGLIKKFLVKPRAVVIDVGSPKGDVNFEEVSKLSSFITPVPGGVGPMTIVSLLENVVEAAQKKLARLK